MCALNTPVFFCVTIISSSLEYSRILWLSRSDIFILYILLLLCFILILVVLYLYLCKILIFNFKLHNDRTSVGKLGAFIVSFYFKKVEWNRTGKSSESSESFFSILMQMRGINIEVNIDLISKNIKQQRIG